MLRKAMQLGLYRDYGFPVGEGEGVTFDVGGTRFNIGGVARVNGGGVLRVKGGVGFCTSGLITGGWQFAAASRWEP